MKRIRTIDGIKYLMRDMRPTSELRLLHAAFEAKYGKLDFHRWLAERGKVHIRITS